MRGKAQLRALYKKFLQGTASRKEFDTFFDRIKDPVEKAEIRRLMAGEWKKQYGKKPSTIFSLAHKEQIFQDIAGNGTKQEMDQLTQITGQKSHHRYKVGAGLAIMIVLIFLVYQSLAPGGLGGKEIANLERTTTLGKKSTFTLPDGSMVWLNAGSKLVYPPQFEGDTREVTLEGEAFFEVASQERRPFIVKSGALVTTIMGTSLNIKSYPEDQAITVAVATGKVVVANREDKLTKPHTLTANMVASYKADNNKINVESRNIQDLVAWREGIIKFNEVPLPEVAKTLERWYGKKVVLENKQVSNCIIYGEFENEGLAYVMKTLQRTIDITYDVTEKGVKISGKGCPDKN